MIPNLRYSARIVALPFLLLSMLAAPPAVAHTQRADYSSQFDLVWRETRKRFYDRSMHGLDWDAIGERYRPKAASARTKAEFQQTVNAMLGELHASHCAYYTDDDFEYYLLQSLFKGDSAASQAEQIGVQGVYEGGTYVVRAILNDGPADRAGIRSGDRILEADGRPFTTVGSFREKAGSTVDLSIERAGQGRITIRVIPIRTDPQAAFLDATRKSVRVLDRDGRRIGYIHLWTMTSDRFREALESALTGPLADTDGLILDLRDGFGGHPSRFTDVLFRPDTVWSESGREDGEHIRGRHSAYAKPLVVLIDNGTRSAKDWFAYQIKKTRRGTLVGTNTAGAFLGASGFAIPPDGFLELPVMDLSLDGKRLEGLGVAPDVMAEPIDTYGPNDRQMERGLQVLLAKLKPVAHASKESGRTDQNARSIPPTGMYPRKNAADSVSSANSLSSVFVEPGMISATSQW